MANREEQFKNAILKKHIPVLILDAKWHKLFAKTGSTDEIKNLEHQLQELLKKQARLSTQNKDLKRVKNDLMDQILVSMNGIESETDAKTLKSLNENKRLINEVNEKLEENEEDLLEAPREIEQTNRELMIKTMELCYDKLQNNTASIEQIADWIREMRIQLKKNIIRKQEMEINNAELYAYMHDIFGSEVVDLFDMKYEPKLPSLKKAENEKSADKQKDETN